MLEDSEGIQFSATELDEARKFIACANQIYDHEDLRIHAYTEFMPQPTYIKSHLFYNSKGTYPDASERLRCPGLKGKPEAIPVVKEFKNEVGGGNSDPATQAEVVWVVVAASSQVR